MLNVCKYCTSVMYNFSIVNIILTHIMIFILHFTLCVHSPLSVHEKSNTVIVNTFYLYTVLKIRLDYWLSSSKYCIQRKYDMNF